MIEHTADEELEKKKIKEILTLKKGPAAYTTDPWNCAQIVPVKVKLFQTIPNETKNTKDTLCNLTTWWYKRISVFS